MGGIGSSGVRLRLPIAAVNRVSSSLYVRNAAKTALGNDHVYPVVQPAPDVFPSVVYYSVGHTTLSTLDRPPGQLTSVIRIEARGKTYSQAVALDLAMVNELKDGGRLIALRSLIDDFDDELSLYRRIRSISIRD